jgi:hypothetical protein
VPKKVFILLLFCLPLLFPASALSLEGEDWTLQGGSQMYDPEMEPLVPREFSEASAYLCVDEKGNSLSLAEQEIFSQISLAAADVFDGTFSFGQGALLSAGDDTSAIPENGGYISGRGGMQNFLRDERALLLRGWWTPYDGRSLLRESAEAGEGIKSYENKAKGWLTTIGSGRPLPRKSGLNITKVLPTNAKHPLALSSNLPEACGLQVPDPKQPSLQTQLQRPGDYLIDQVLYVPGKLAYSTQEFLQPHAFRYTFWTPHTERGDLMWEVPTSCVPKGDKYFSTAERKGACEAYTPLGYSDNLVSNSKENSWFLAAAKTLQWLVSGTYFLILFASALLYMFRGSTTSIGGILQIVPRIFLAMIFTLLAGFFMGSLISLSNHLVQLVFSFDSSPAVGSLNTFLLQAGNIVGGPDIIQRLVSLLVGIFTVFFFAVFLLASLLRQILLVALIILAPLAALAFIVPSWKRYFSFYWRTLAACLLLPVILALVLKIGVSINPLLLRPEAAYGEIQGFLGILLVLVTLWLMYRFIRFSYEFALRGSSALQLDEMRSLLGSEKKSLERGGAELTPLKEAPAPALPLASERAKSLPGEEKKRLIEGEKATPTHSASQSTWSSFQNKKKERKRLSNAAAKRYKEGLLQFLHRMRKGEKPLTPEEQKKAIEAYAKHKGGYLEKHNGSWHLRG